MAKKSMIAKNKRPAKFSTQAYTRCERCGRPHSVYRKFRSEERRVGKECRL